jgi:hypothetical protein
MAMPDPRFPVGTQFYSTGKHPRLCTVTDIWRTYNQAGELVRLRYVATHEFMGQTLTDRDVLETTIARNIVKHGA